MLKYILSILFLFTAIIAYTQEALLKQKINLSKRKYIVSDLLNEIHQQSQVEFSYTSEFNSAKKIELKRKSGSMDYFLKQVIDLSIFKVVCLDKKIFVVKIPFEEQKFRLSGFVKDSETGESLINATIYNPDTFEGTISNNFGFYSFYQKKKHARIKISYIGYQDKEIEISNPKDTILNVGLKANKLLSEVKIVADNKGNNINHLFLSTYSVSGNDLSQKSVLGINDLFRNISYLPGVQTANEASSGLIVRSGSPDQNLILFDDVPVYYQSHLLGLFSIFNPDAIHKARLIKGGFPAQYGGRVSSVLDIRMKDGNLKKLEGEFSLGLLTTKLNLRGPIVKNKTSFNLSVRRSYLDLLTGMLFNLADADLPLKYYFGDLNFKISHKFSNKDKLYISTYMGRDMAKIKVSDVLGDLSTGRIENKIGWGNLTNSLRWNHVYNDRLFGNTSFILSRYTYFVKDKRSIQAEDSSFKESYYHEFFSGIRDYSLKSEFDFIPDPKHYYKFGFESNFHVTKPGSNFYRNNKLIDDNSTNDKSVNSFELALYAENQVQWNPKLLTNIGVRTTGFSLKDKTYFSFEPRLTAQYKLNRSLSFNSGFSIMSQYMHLITSSTLSLPTDIWLPVNDKIKPIRSYQYNLGSILNLGSDFSLDTEIYYKSTKNILEFSDKYYTGDGTPSWDEQVESGKSWSTGFELMLRKDKGKTQGHLVYTLAKSMVNYNQLNHGRTFASPYDRRHDLSMQLSRKLNSKLDITLNWVYGSGLPVTLPSQVIKSISPYNPQSLGQVPIFSERNAIRMPEYHRLDLSLNFKKKKRHGTRIWNIGIYNVYNRKNASFVYMTQDYNYDGTSMFSLRQLSLFGFIPSFSYSYQF